MFSLVYIFNNKLVLNKWLQKWCPFMLQNAKRHRK